MARTTAFEVSTKVIIDQAEAIVTAMNLPDHAQAVASLEREGLPKGFVEQLNVATRDLIRAESDQERIKTEYLRETKEDQALAERGAKWVKRLQAKARVYLATQERDTLDLAGQLRFGQLKNARSRGVTYELRILIPEAHEHQALLGLDTAFIVEGHDILRLLGIDLKETADVKAQRKTMTERVRAGELLVTRLLGQLRAADQAAALERDDEKLAFPLSIIATEIARAKAAGERRKAAEGLDDDLDEALEGVGG